MCNFNLALREKRTQLDEKLRSIFQVSVLEFAEYVEYAIQMKEKKTNHLKIMERGTSTLTLFPLNLIDDRIFRQDVG